MSAPTQEQEARWLKDHAEMHVDIYADAPTKLTEGGIRHAELAPQIDAIDDLSTLEPFIESQAAYLVLKAVSRHYYENSTEPLAAIAEEFGVSRAFVTQVRSKMLDRLGLTSHLRGALTKRKCRESAQRRWDTGKQKAPVAKPEPFNPMDILNPSLSSPC